MEWIWMTQSKSRPKLGEWINKKILIKPSLFGALKDSLPYVAMVDGAGQARAIQTLQKVTATPPVPITFLGSSFHLQIEQDLTSCGPIKPQRPVCSGSCYPHIWSHTHGSMFTFKFTSGFRHSLEFNWFPQFIWMARLQIFTASVPNSATSCWILKPRKWLCRQ